MDAGIALRRQERQKAEEEEREITKDHILKMRQQQLNGSPGDDEENESGEEAMPERSDPVPLPTRKDVSVVEPVPP